MMRRAMVGRGSLTAALLLAACAGGLAFSAARARPPAPSGATIFAQNCAACHQAQGQGVPGAFPKLQGDAFVRGPAPQVAYLLTHGRGGMPSFASDLDDGQIAAVLTYVRSAWGNHAPPITPATVAAARKGTAKEEKSVMPYH